MRRIAIAAVEAAFDQQDQSAGKKQKRSRLPATRALLIGAGLMTAGRIALSGRGRGLLDSLEERLAQFEGRDADLPPEEDEDFEDEGFDDPEAEDEPDAYDEEDEEPEAYEDEDYEDEDYVGDEEPEAHEDEDDYADDEGEDEEPEEEMDERRERTAAGSRRRRRS